MKRETEAPSKSIEAFTVAEIAEQWRMSKRHVRNLIYAEKLPKIPGLGRCIRVSADAVRNFMGKSNDD